MSRGTFIGVYLAAALSSIFSVMYAFGLIPTEDNSSMELTIIYDTMPAAETQQETYEVEIEGIIHTGDGRKEYIGYGRTDNWEGTVVLSGPEELAVGSTVQVKGSYCYSAGYDRYITVGENYIERI